MREFFLTLGYAGYAKKAPGTVGSAVALVLGVLLLEYLPSSETYTNESTLLLLAIMIGVISIKQIDIHEKETGKNDDQIIVIDELVGMWIALALSGATIFQIVASFIFFRILDIKKPSIIGKADKMKGGMGVVLDDALAGLFAGLLSALSYKIYLYLLTMV